MDSRILKPSLLFICALLFCPASLAINVDDIAIGVDQDIELIIEKSGMQAVMDTFPDMIESQFQQQAAQSTPATQQKNRVIADVIKNNFNPESVLSDFKDHITRHATADELAQIADWLQGPLATEMIDAEMQMLEPEFNNMLIEYAAKMESNPPSQQRIELISRLEEASQTTDLALAFFESTVKGMVMSMSKGDENPVSEQHIEQQLEAMRPMMVSAFKQQYLLSFHYIYQEISAENLEAYIAFYESRLGRMYLNLLSGALIESLGKYFNGLASQIKAI